VDGGVSWRFRRLLPPRRDVLIAGTFLSLSLLQVLEEPIAGPLASLAVAIGSTLPLAWRRVHPAAAALAGTVVWFIPTHGFLFLGYVVAVLLYFSVGNEIRRLPVVVTVTGVGTLLGVVATLLTDQPPPTALGSALAITAPAAAGRIVAHQRAQTARLHELTEQLVRERVTAEQVAVAEERGRIARELHDVIGHDVTVIVLQADAAAAALQKAPQLARAPVAAIRDAAADVLTEMRSVLGVLRAEPGQRLRPQPGLADLPALVEEARRAGEPVTLELAAASRPVPATVQLAAYRLVQEALTNARRHARGAAVQVHVEVDRDAVVVRVLDSGGRAEQTNGAGFGLVGMRERVRLLGGQLETGQRSGGGFAVSARLPLGPTEPP
jgi:signal transduction histidine kinase